MHQVIVHPSVLEGPLQQQFLLEFAPQPNRLTAVMHQVLAYHPILRLPSGGGIITYIPILGNPVTQIKSCALAY